MFEGKRRRNCARLGTFPTHRLATTAHSKNSRCPSGRGLKILLDLRSPAISCSPHRRRAICYVFSPFLLLLLLLLLFLLPRTPPPTPTLPATSPAAASPAATPLLVVVPPTLRSAGQAPRSLAAPVSRTASFCFASLLPPLCYSSKRSVRVSPSNYLSHVYPIHVLATLPERPWHDVKPLL